MAIRYQVTESACGGYACHLQSFEGYGRGLGDSRATQNWWISLTQRIPVLTRTKYVTVTNTLKEPLNIVPFLWRRTVGR